MQSSSQTYVAPKVRQIIAEAAFRRKYLVLWTTCLLTALTLVLSLAMHRKYEAHAKLIVQNVRTAAQLTTSNTDHLISQGDVSQAEINTEVNLLESDGVARRALGLSHESEETAQSHRLTEKFKQQLTVEAVHQTNVIDLKMLGGSPADAKHNLQHVIDAYFEERAGAATNSGAAEFFEEQLADKTRQLNADQQALTQFEMDHGIADLEDQKKLQVTRLSALQDALASADASFASLGNKSAQEQRVLSATPARSETLVRTITNQYTQERLNTTLVDLQNRRTELLKRYVPTDRQITEIEEKILTLRRALNDAASHPATEQATDVNPVWLQLSGMVATSSGDLSGLEGQRTKLAAQIEAAKGRLDELESATSTYGDLRRKLQQSQSDYALYAQRRDEARISEALDRQKLFDVAVTQGPLASAEAVRPRPVLYVATAFLFSLLLGISMAVYGDLASGQVYTPAQLDALTGSRTWATIADEASAPFAKTANRNQLRRLLFAMRQAIVGGRATHDVNHQLTPREGDPAVLSPVHAGSDALGICVAFTSALPGDGVTFTVNQLAQEATRNAPARVAILDTRTLLQKVTVGKIPDLAMQLAPGASHWTLGAPEPLHQEALGPAVAPDRRMQTAGQLRRALRQMRHEYDLVLLDCPNLASSTMAGELAACVDGYVLVVRAGVTRKQNIEDAAAQLSVTSVPVMGHVLNGRDYPLPRWLHKII